MRLRPHTCILLTIGVLAAGVLACQERGETGEEAAAEESTLAAAHMQEHFTQAIALRDAVIAGDLAAAQEPATWMAEHQMAGGVPEGWAPHVAEMQAAASGAVEATELEAAALAAGGPHGMFPQGSGGPGEGPTRHGRGGA